MLSNGVKKTAAQTLFPSQKGARAQYLKTHECVFGVKVPQDDLKQATEFARMQSSKMKVGEYLSAGGDSMFSGYKVWKIGNKIALECISDLKAMSLFVDVDSGKILHARDFRTATPTDHKNRAPSAEEITDFYAMAANKRESSVELEPCSDPKPTK